MFRYGTVPVTAAARLVWSTVRRIATTSRTTITLRLHTRLSFRYGCSHSSWLFLRISQNGTVVVCVTLCVRGPENWWGSIPEKWRENLNRDREINYQISKYLVGLQPHQFHAWRHRDTSHLAATKSHPHISLLRKIQDGLDQLDFFSR